MTYENSITEIIFLEKFLLRKVSTMEKNVYLVANHDFFFKRIFHF